MKDIKLGYIGTRLFVIVISFWFISSCTNNNLTREKAFQILNNNLPKYITGLFCYGKLEVRAKDEDVKRMAMLQRDGAISWNYVKSANIFGETLETYLINFTPSGKKYYLEEAKRDDIGMLGARTDIMTGNAKIAKIIIGERQLISVTGIKLKNNREAEVEFLWKAILSPFGRAVQQRRGYVTIGSMIHEGMKIGPDDTQYSGKAFMSLYDDGWRIEKAIIENENYTFTYRK